MFVVFVVALETFLSGRILHFDSFFRVSTFNNYLCVNFSEQTISAGECLFSNGFFINGKKVKVEGLCTVDSAVSHMHNVSLITF